MTLNDRDCRRREGDDCRRPADGRPGHAVRHLGRRDRGRRHLDRQDRGWRMPGHDCHPVPAAHRSGGQQGVPHRTD
ncbi:hypothetical protein XFF6990_240039 [Xanthomonas citri pv. fuscans]|nr:hypothetical protein XFF6990_240039 [Xanthomonas citri pv. fuscans]